jgi:hypothetical protein
MAHRACATRKPECASIDELRPGKSVVLGCSRNASPSSRMSRLCSRQSLLRKAAGRAPHMSEVFVPSCPTMTALNVGS